MKQTSKKLVLLLALTLVIFSFTNVETNQKNSTKSDKKECILEDINTAGLGDVKHSILSVTAFQAVNGDEWVLLDGKSKDELLGAGYTGASVFDYMTIDDNGGNTNIADGRGVFIRSKDNGAGNNPAGELLLGAFQADEFKAHSHFVHSSQSSNATPTNTVSALANGVPGLFSFRNASTAPADNSPSSTEGGAETRSKNITVNTFVKIKPGCIDASTETQIDLANAKIAALEDYILRNSCDACINLPEGDTAQLKAKNVCFKTEIDAFEAQTKDWSVSCLARTIGSSKKVLMQIGADNRDQAENDFLSHLDNQYPYYNAIETKK